MDKKSKKKVKLKKKLLLFIGIFIFVIIGNFFERLSFMEKNVVEAKNVEATLDIIGINSPVRMALFKKANIIEKEKARKVVEEFRRKAEEERVRKAEEEKLKEEEAIRLAREEEEKLKNQKIAYLTFDDGPSEIVTPLILDILKEYNVKATFFVVGNMVETNPDILIRTYEEGHKIANHSYSHNYNYIYKNSTNFMEDINRANSLLKEVLGKDYENNIIRFPGGSFGKNKSPMKKVVIEAGYKYYDWNALNGDAEGLNLTNKYLVNRLKETTANKKEVIILMHDTDAKKQTAETLRESLDYLISQGFVFKVLE